MNHVQVIFLKKIYDELTDSRIKIYALKVIKNINVQILILVEIDQLMGWLLISIFDLYIMYCIFTFHEITSYFFFHKMINGNDKMVMIK